MVDWADAIRTANRAIGVLSPWTVGVRWTINVSDRPIDTYVCGVHWNGLRYNIFPPVQTPTDPWRVHVWSRATERDARAEHDTSVVEALLAAIRAYDPSPVEYGWSPSTPIGVYRWQSAASLGALLGEDYRSIGQYARHYANGKSSVPVERRFCDHHPSRQWEYRIDPHEEFVRD